MGETEFYRLLARELDCTAKTAKKYANAMVEVIAKEVYLSGHCQVPYLGSFDAKEIPEKVQRHKDEDGNVVQYTIPEHIMPIFTATDNFINDCNLRGVTREYRKRVKRKMLTKHDLERIAKAESMKRLRNISQEDKEVAKTAFSDKLKEIKQAHDADK